LKNDIALLKLSTPVTFNSQISPVCLASAAPPVGTIAVTTGWGQAEFGMPNKLRQVGVTVRQNSMCDSNPLYLSSKQICAGDGKFAQQSFTMDSCSGDSGGPLLQKQGSTYFLSGIVR
jgi:secreted trypsin-like serine protease